MNSRMSLIWVWIVPGLIVLGAVASVVFLFLTESYNTPVLDDLGFINTLRNTSIGRYVANMYLTWEGRYMSFIEHGVQYRMYELFHSTIPYSILLYVIEIALLQSALRMSMRISVFHAIIYAMWVWGLFVVCLPDLASYFWMCTKVYPLLVVMAVWLLAKIYFSASRRWYDYLEIVVVSCFVGCSTEVFAPMVLVLMGIRILRKWKQCAWSITMLFQREGLLCVAFIVAAINFFAMVFAPGTFVRMEVLSDKSSLSMVGYATGLADGIMRIGKMIFFKLHYYIAFFVVSLVLLLMRSTADTKLSAKAIGIRFVRNVLIVVGLFMLSIMLCLYATGEPFVARAMAQLPAAIFILLFLLAKDLSCVSFFQNVVWRHTTLILAFWGGVFVASNLVYATVSAYSELEIYKESRIQREVMLQNLEAIGNTETIYLETLHTPQYHSIMDDAWRKVMPKYSKIVILRTDEVGDRVDFYYNVEFRRYYHLSFDVISDIVWVGV